MKRLLLLALPLLLAGALVFVFLHRSPAKGPTVAALPDPAPVAAVPVATDTNCVVNAMPAENPDAARPNLQPAQEGAARPLPEWAAVLDNYTEAELDPRRESTLESRQGTRITLPPYALQLPDGTVPDGPVKITVQEFYSPAAIALAGLATQSGSRLLESGGMVYVDARYKDQPLRLRKGASYSLDMPYTEKKKGMRLFRGQSSGEYIDWEALNWGEAEQLLFYRQPFVRPEAYDSLVQLLRSRLQWPQDVEGTTTWWEASVHFTISEEGKAERVRIENSMSPGFTDLVETALKSRPQQPVGWADGKAAAAAFTQRFTFRWPSDKRDARDFQVERSNLFVDSVYGKAGARYYTFRAPMLGWINCDRFYDDPRARENLYVRSDDPAVDMTLVFTSANSMMRGERTDSGFVFPNVPKGEEVTVLAMKKKGKTYEMGMECHRVGSGPVQTPRLAPMSLAAVHSSLKTLNTKKTGAGGNAVPQNTQP